MLQQFGAWHLKANAAIDSIKKTHTDSRIGFVPLDLFSFTSIRRLPAALAAMQTPPIGSLILNTGGLNVKAKSLEFTEDAKIFSNPVGAK